MILAALPKSSPPYDFQFAGSETQKTNSGDTSHHVEHLQKSTSDYIKYRVRTVMKNLEKSWNFKTAFSRPGKVLEK